MTVWNLFYIVAVHCFPLGIIDAELEKNSYSSSGASDFLDVFGVKQSFHVSISINAADSIVAEYFLEVYTLSQLVNFIGSLKKLEHGQKHLPQYYDLSSQSVGCVSMDSLRLKYFKLNHKQSLKSLVRSSKRMLVALNLKAGKNHRNATDVSYEILHLMIAFCRSFFELI